jgi:hypothetical protein
MKHFAPVELRGRRSPAAVLRLAIRDHLLRLARDRYCTGMSDRQAAVYLRERLGRYAAGAWRRHQSEDRLPEKLRGTLNGIFWEMMMVRASVPGDRTVRTALAHDFPLPT